MFGFDGQHRTLSQSLQEGTGFEPWVWYYQPAPKGKPASKAYKEVFRFNENVHTGKHRDYMCPLSHAFLDLVATAGRNELGCGGRLVE